MSQHSVAVKCKKHPFYAPCQLHLPCRRVLCFLDPVARGVEVAFHWFSVITSDCMLYTRLSTVGNRAFPVAAARVWNEMPHHVTVKFPRIVWRLASSFLLCCCACEQWSYFLHWTQISIIAYLLNILHNESNRPAKWMWNAFWQWRCSDRPDCSQSTPAPRSHCRRTCRWMERRPAQVAGN